MYFSDFLLNKKILKKRELLLAYAKQLETMPSILSLILEYDLAADKDLLGLLKESFDKKCDVLFLLKEKKILKEEQIVFLVEQQNKRKITFGQALVKLGYMNIQQVEMLLNEYLENKSHAQSDIQTASVSSSSSSTITSSGSDSSNSTSALGTEAVIETKDPDIPTFQFVEIDQSNIDEYAQLLDQEKKTFLENTILSWSKGLDKNSLREFYRELHTLKGTSRFLKAQVTEYLIHNFENLISTITSNMGAITSDNYKKFDDICFRSMDLVWELRESIIQNASEASLWSRTSFRENLIRVINDIFVLIDHDLNQTQVNNFDIKIFKDQF